MIAKHIQEFSKNAYCYDAYTSLQQEVAHYLVSHISTQPQKILDLGCGSGAVFKNISWPFERFIGVDCAINMCNLHPKSSNVKLMCERFESSHLFETHYDLILSSSALQWADDIVALIHKIALSCKEGAFAIFTDKTFDTLYSMSGLNRFLPNAQALISLFETLFTCKVETKTFRLYFEDNLSKFRHIKKSGVSGGQKQLSVTQTKALITHYPYDYLEYEVLFVWGFPK
ncbi:methyltransferase domain-containing protein [Sulfurospirillum barnesii]|uniref:Methyltransferase family protein n=1 Tax=Sulfurospirillum barnesii (strain ATCC 700032 / DSM 10660 / SES-3) TaxID=760154 RepID=I3Y0T5_SULBS|nr:methyltransferase domain-containing protein [Sulfurospirillum barnesii]AFL69809.1 methyltransferase family protein [Sulfurospirillum barnesii SES-3]